MTTYFGTTTAATIGSTPSMISTTSMLQLQLLLPPPQFLLQPELLFAKVQAQIIDI